MEQKLLSIYVGNEVTRICEVVKKSAVSIIVNNATEIATPPGSVDDGYITDVPAIAEAIRGCVFGRGFTATRAIFTIASKKIANKEVVIPFVRGEKKIAQILEANASEYFPMSTTGDFIFANSLMEVFQDDEGKKCRLTAVAAPRDLIEGYYELAEELKIHVDNIDYVGNSVLQLLSLQMKDTSTELVLQIEKDMTFVNVMSGKSIILQRTVPYGKNAVINSMMEIKKLTEKDAKTLLSNRDMLDRQVTEDEYAEAVRYLISSIGRIVEYHRSRNPDRIIDGIKVFGEGSAIAGIDEVLHQELGAEVTHFQTLQGIKVSGKAYLTSDEALRYLANFGAVLKPIGLSLVYGKAKERASKDVNKVLFALLILSVLFSVGFVTIKYITYFTTVALRNATQAQIDEIADVEEIANQYNAAMTAYGIVEEFSMSTRSENELLLRFITDLEQCLPKGTRINNLKSTDGEITFDVVTIDKQSVADIIVEVGKLDYVTNLSIPNMIEDMTAVKPPLDPEAGEEGSTAVLDEYTNQVINFNFSCSLQNPEWASQSAEAAAAAAAAQPATENVEGGTQ